MDAPRRFTVFSCRTVIELSFSLSVEWNSVADRSLVSSCHGILFFRRCLPNRLTRFFLMTSQLSSRSPSFCVDLSRESGVRLIGVPLSSLLVSPKIRRPFPFEGKGPSRLFFPRLNFVTAETVRIFLATLPFLLSSPSGAFSNR